MERVSPSYPRDRARVTIRASLSWTTRRSQPVSEAAVSAPSCTERWKSEELSESFPCGAAAWRSSSVLGDLGAKDGKGAKELLQQMTHSS